MPLAASCRTVVAALQRQDGVLTNSRLPCSTAENARVLYMRLLPSTPVSGCTQANTWCGAEDGGMYVLPHSTRPSGGPVPSPWA